MRDVIACGELLIDFVATKSGVTLSEAPAFQKAPGGAPANVAVGVARLGLTSGCISKVGDDDFGHFLTHILQENGVDTQHMCLSTQARTTLAFVSLRSDGEREFLFYRQPGADMLLAPEDVDETYIASARVFHYGSFTLSNQPSRDATLHAVNSARAHNVFISYDPNLRLSLWPSAEAARADMMLGWPHANMIKVSEEELFFLSGTNDLQQAVRQFWHERLRLLVVTQGSEGCTYFTAQGWGHVPGFSVKTIDTTGAGDGFLSGLLYKLCPRLDHAWEKAEIEAALRFANAVGALTTTRNGAIPALPTRREVEDFLAEHAAHP